MSWQISFQPLVQCLDVDNFIKLFTAVLLERRILLRSDKYFLWPFACIVFCNLSITLIKSSMSFPGCFLNGIYLAILLWIRSFSLTVLRMLYVNCYG